jgi:choline kinase
MIERAVILAAGLGVRLKPHTDNAPKCLTEVNGTPILFNTLRNLSDLGISSCTLVVGYMSSVIRETVGERFERMCLQYVENEQYRTTNDMFSLWLSREELPYGTLILEGDIFFHAQALARALDQAQHRSFYLAGLYDGNPHEILIVTDSDLRVRSVKVLHERGEEPRRLRYMSSGILLLQPAYGESLSRWLSSAVKAGRVDVLFDQIISEHVSEKPLHVVEIDHKEWVEIDTPGDLALAEKMFP